MKTLKLFPGIILSMAIAFLAIFIEGLLPIHLIGSAVIVALAVEWCMGLV